MKIRVSIFIFFLFKLSLLGEVVLKSNLYGPDNLDPMKSWDVSSLNYTYNIYDTLLKYDEKSFKLLPSLAVKWDIRKNGREYILSLRKGVKFHDGTKFNADSVVFNFKRGLKRIGNRYKYPVFYELFQQVKDVRKISEYKVLFELKEPFSPFLYTLTSIIGSIISPTAIKKYGDKIGKHPVGTGPFMFKEWIKGKRIVLIKNKSYWKGQPSVDTFVSIFPENFGDSLFDPLFLINHGKIDFSRRYSISKMVSLKRIKWIKIKKIPIWGINFLNFNLKKKIFKNVYFRRALNYLWNKRYLRYIYQEYVNPVDSLLPQNVPGYNAKSIVKYDYSIDKAKEMLRKAKIKGNITLKYVTADFPSSLFDDIIIRYKLTLKKVGIDLRIVRFSYKDYLKQMRKGDYDIILSGFIADYPEVYSYLSPLFSETAEKFGISSFSSYENIKIIKKLIKEASLEFSLKKREKIYEKINEIATSDAICIPTMQMLELIIHRNNIVNLSEDAIGAISLYNVKVIDEDKN